MLIINKFLSFFEIQAYYIQQIIYQFVSSELDHVTPRIFILLLIGGCITSINPCFISMFPLSISYINNKKNIAKYTFIAGLISSIIIIMSFTVILNNYYNKSVFNIPILSSLIVIIIALNLLQILDLNNFIINAIKLNKLNLNQNIPNFIMGLIFGLSTGSCSTPILTTLLLWLSNTNNILLGTIYITCYLIGYIIPVIILIEITIQYSNINIISRAWNYIMPASGSFMLGIGCFSLLEHIFLD